MKILGRGILHTAYIICRQQHHRKTHLGMLLKFLDYGQTSARLLRENNWLELNSFEEPRSLIFDGLIMTMYNKDLSCIFMFQLLSGPSIFWARFCLRFYYLDV